MLRGGHAFVHGNKNIMTTGLVKAIC